MTYLYTTTFLNKEFFILMVLFYFVLFYLISFLLFVWVWSPDFPLPSHPLHLHGDTMVWDIITGDPSQLDIPRTPHLWVYVFIYLLFYFILFCCYWDVNVFFSAMELGMFTWVTIETEPTLSGHLKICSFWHFQTDCFLAPWDFCLMKIKNRSERKVGNICLA